MTLYKPGLINETLNNLRLISKGKLKEGQAQGGVNLTYNLGAGFVSGTFSFPIDQIDGPDGMIIKAVDFVEAQEPITENGELANGS